MAATFEHGDQVRAVLAAIVADPALGPEVLSSPTTLSDLLAEYLPASAREARPLLAAAQQDIPGVLSEHVAQGMDCPAAIELAAARLAARSAFSDQVCLWVATEFALALGLATADELSRSGSSGEAAASRHVAPALDDSASQSLLPFGGPRHARSPGSRPGRSHGQWIRLAAITAGAVVVAAGASGIGIVLLSRHHAPGQRHPRRILATTPTVSATATPAPDPATVAKEYVSDVNEGIIKGDWQPLWQLGGGNVMLPNQQDPGPFSRSQMVANFQHTDSDTSTSVATAHGSAAFMCVKAIDTLGTQYYEIYLAVSSGRIVFGWQTLREPDCAVP